MKITELNTADWGAGTLINAYREMEEFQSEDVDRLTNVMKVQLAVGEELERRGWQLDEEEEWTHQNIMPPNAQ